MKTTTTIRSSLMVLMVCLMACVGASKLQAQTPTITSFTPASGSVGTLVTITGTNLSSLTAFTIGGVNAIVVSNTGSSLVGMVMPGAVTGGVVVTTAGGTANGSSNFAVMPTSFPSVQQGGKLVGTGAIVGTYGALQGSAVAISGDGSTAIISSYPDDNDKGAVWIFTKNNGIWTQQGGKLVGTGANNNFIGANQGYSVSLSADGTTAVVGGPHDNKGVGAVWVFVRSGNTWNQQGTKLVANDAVQGHSGSQQGKSVSLSADGNTLLVGGSTDDNNKGAAWIFTRSGNVWLQQGVKLVGSGAIDTTYGANQGFSVVISADGNTAIVGGFGDSLFNGAAWIFTRNGSTWTQQGSKLVGTGGIGSNVRQGYSVSLSADGNTALVGGWEDSLNLGATWVFTRTDTTWSQQGNKLVGTGSIGSYVRQGFSVSISADGNTAICGSTANNGDQGGTWVFTRSGNIWTQQGPPLLGNGVIGAAQQGTSVSLSADGNTAIIGGPSDNFTYGAAWVFVSSSPLPVKLLSFTGTKQATNNLLHWSTATEQNNKGFELQRSANGEHFSKIAFVNTKAVNGNSTRMLTYSFTDKTSLKGNNYYRLKQVDNDGKETLSNVVLIKGETGNESMTVELFPNPGSSHFTLIINSSNTQPVSIRVMDAVGNLVYEAKGNATQPFRFGEKFSNGTYLVEVRQGDEVKTVKAVKMK